MLMLLCWSAFVSTLTLTIAMDLHWIFPVMFLVGFFVAATYDPDNKKKREDTTSKKESV